MGSTKLHWISSLHRTSICTFSVRFNLHICCIVSEWQHVRGDWGRKLRPNFALYPPPPTLVKLGKGGQDIRVRVSSSAEDLTSAVLLVRGYWVCWEVQHIFPNKFRGGNSEMGQPNYTEFWEDIYPSWMLPYFLLNVGCFAFFRNYSASKSIIRPTYHISPPCKN